MTFSNDTALVITKTRLSLVITVQDLGHFFCGFVPLGIQSNLRGTLLVLFLHFWMAKEPEQMLEQDRAAAFEVERSACFKNGWHEEAGPQ